MISSGRLWWLWEDGLTINGTILFLVNCYFLLHLKCYLDKFIKSKKVSAFSFEPFRLNSIWHGYGWPQLTKMIVLYILSCPIQLFVVMSKHVNIPVKKNIKTGFSIQPPPRPPLRLKTGMEYSYYVWSFLNTFVAEKTLEKSFGNPGCNGERRLWIMYSCNGSKMFNNNKMFDLFLIFSCDSSSI